MGFLGIWLIAFTAPYFINPASLNWGKPNLVGDFATV